MRYIFTLVVIMIFTFSAKSFSQTVDTPYEIGAWKNFTDAVAVYTFDDNTPNQNTIVIPLFDEFNFKATFNPVISWGPNWNIFRAAAQNGHEIGSHTVTHTSLNTLTIEKQTEELSDSKSKINTEIPGIDCNTIAYPNCNMGDVPTISKYYIAGRTCSGQIVPKTPTNYYDISSVVCGNMGLNDLSSFKTRLSNAAKVNGWFVMLYHAIDNDNGYSPVSSHLLRNTVEFLNANKRLYWVSTFRDAVLYSKERDAVSVKELSNTASEITVEVTDNLDNNVYNLPVSIKRPLPEGWTNAVVTQNGVAVESGIYRMGGNLFIVFNAIPDAGTVSIIPSGETPAIVEEQAAPIDPEYSDPPEEPKNPDGLVETSFDFETGNINNWTRLNPGAGIDVTQEDKHAGTYSLKMVNGTATDAWSVQVRSPEITISKGDIYKVSFWVKAVGGGGQGRISTGAASQLGASQYWHDFTVGSEWEQITYNNLTATGDKLQLVFDMGYIANKTYYIDDIVLENLSSKSGYDMIELDTQLKIVSDLLNKKLQIMFPGENTIIKDIKLLDISGKPIYHKGNVGLNTTTITTTDLSAGIYICSVSTGTNRINKKVVVY